MAERRPAIIWSPEAVADIEQLWDYYVQAAGRGPADGILREIAKAVAVLDEFSAWRPRARHAAMEVAIGRRDCFR